MCKPLNGLFSLKLLGYRPQLFLCSPWYDTPGLRGRAISHKREPLDDRMVSNVPERGATIAGNSRKEFMLLTKGLIRLIPADE